VSKKVTIKAPRRAGQSELENLFDDIVDEISEREQFLNDLVDMGQLTKETELRVKDEIASRVSELQKIKDMMNAAEEKKA